MHLSLVHSSCSLPAAPQPEWRFTTRDLMALADWMRRADAHGYRRVMIETGMDTGMPEEGGYVLLYAPGRLWANWGIARSRDAIVIWHCGSGADIGRFPSMMDALESLPPARTVLANGRN